MTRQNHSSQYLSKGRLPLWCAVVVAAATSLPTSCGFTSKFSSRRGFISKHKVFIYAPPGSGYSRPEDERSVLPDTYDAMMEYPGTMRPGKTPENMPFHDLPIGDNDPDPVPWPHFQQIEWHHRWEPPHEHPIPMEEFIEMQGRWATPEMEATMRAGIRRGVREQRELAEKRETIITDDEDEDDYDYDNEPVSLGDGIFGKLGSAADQAATAAATAPNKEDVDEEFDYDEDDELDDFLLDLGLDADIDEDEKPAKRAPPTRPVPRSSLDEDENDEEDVVMSMKGTASINVDEDDDLDLVLDDDDDLDGEGMDTVPLDDFGDSDSLDVEDIFDEGGFDFDDGDFGDGDFGDGDMW